MAQHARLEIAQAAPRVDQPAGGIARHGVDRQVAPQEVFLERDLGRRVHDEAAVAGRGLALRAGQRVLLAAVGMQEDGEVAPHGPEAPPLHLLRGGADHDPVALADRQAEQFVTNGAADQVDFHRGIVAPPAWRRGRLLRLRPCTACSPQFC
jgi:hypothetical protein